VARPSTVLLRRLTAKRRILHHGIVHYADATEVGTIIDSHDMFTREKNPIVLERFLPASRPPSNPPTLMANPIRPAVWEVIESYASFDTGLPRAKKAKAEPMHKGVTLRLRDRRTNDIILCDVL
jgi:hypothetical protein